MKTRDSATVVRRQLQREQVSSYDWTTRELSTSAITALLVLGAQEGWTSDSYQRCSDALDYVDAIGSLRWQQLADRRGRLQ